MFKYIRLPKLGKITCGDIEALEYINPDKMTLGYQEDLTLEEIAFKEKCARVVLNTCGADWFEKLGTIHKLRSSAINKELDKSIDELSE